MYCFTQTICLKIKKSQISTIFLSIAEILILNCLYVFIQIIAYSSNFEYFGRQDK